MRDRFFLVGFVIAICLVVGGLIAAMIYHKEISWLTASKLSPACAAELRQVGNDLLHKALSEDGDVHKEIANFECEGSYLVLVIKGSSTEKEVWDINSRESYAGAPKDPTIKPCLDVVHEGFAAFSRSTDRLKNWGNLMCRGKYRVLLVSFDFWENERLRQ